jgi:SAM-dependent MidA family methyltransferase
MPDDPAIPFDEFMRRALYDPHKGYYSRHMPGLGRSGDFTTIPLITNALAQHIAAWILSARRETGCHDVIEIGPGEGQLAHAVRQHLPWHIRLRTRFHLVEISPPLRTAQQRLLGNQARWHNSPQAALAACHGRALIYSNELVDAFPVRRFQLTVNGWRELGVHLTKNAPLRESLLPPAPLPDSSSFAHPHPTGQIIEVHDSYRSWLTSWLPLWHAGRLLTIDYGNSADLLYHRQPHGTLRAYLLHQRITGPAILENPGRQDLTADVNFTDLTTWSQPWMAKQNRTNLRNFCGPDAPPWLREESGPGHAFLVLDELRHTTGPHPVAGT